MIAQQQESLGTFAATIGVMIVLIMAVTVGIYVYRSRLFKKDAPASAGANSVLESLRQLRDSGQISEEEFLEARSKIVARAAGTAPEARPPADRSKPVQDGELRARPGFDLTGEPLPGPDSHENPETDVPGSG